MAKRKKDQQLSEIFMVDNVEVRSIDELISYANNPKDHPEWQIDRLAHLIKSFGFLVPIVIDKRGEIGAGEGRLRAARKLGMNKIPTVRAEHLSEGQLKAFRIADNQAARTGWWEDALRMEIKSLEEMGIDLSLTGFSMPELEAWREPDEPPPPPGPGAGGGNGAGGGTDAGPDWLDKLVQKWGTEEGQIWEIPSKALAGQAHRLVCGDSRDPEMVKTLMAGAKAAMVFTDPPYGVDYVSENHDKIANDELDREALVAFLRPCFVNLVEHTVDQGAFYIWHASATREDYSFAMKAAGIIEQQYLIWAKESLNLGWQDYQWAHEPCFYASKAGYLPKWYGDRAQGTVWRIEAVHQGGAVAVVLNPGLILNDGDGNEVYVSTKAPKKKLRTIRLPPAGQSLLVHVGSGEQDLWEVSRDTKPRHPTQKPAKLAIAAIRNSSVMGEIVLDLFLGSGATMIAAESEARLCYGAELSPRHVAGTLQWLADMGVQPALVDHYKPAG